MLQFKAPWPSSQVDSLYKFSINTDQHRTLEDGPCKDFPESVFYVFPLFTTWSKVHHYAPYLTKDTWLLRTQAIDSARLGFSQVRHRVEINKTVYGATASVFSPRIDEQLLNGYEVFSDLNTGIPTTGWISSGVLMERLAAFGRDYPYERTRGLYALFLPDSEQSP